LMKFTEQGLKFSKMDRKVRGNVYESKVKFS